MKPFTLLLILSGIVHLALAQQTYVSKHQITVGKYKNGQVPISSAYDTYFFKTDFDFKSLIGSHYRLMLISPDNEASKLRLTLKAVRLGSDKTEKTYEFTVADGSSYPKNYLQISGSSKDASFDACVTIQNDVGKFLFYCKKI